jgi:hypothetical protein
VGRLFAAPIAELLEFYLSLNLLLIPVGIVIPPFADGAPHRDQIVGPFHLRHGRNNSAFQRETQIAMLSERSENELSVPDF